MAVDVIAEEGGRLSVYAQFKELNPASKLKVSKGLSEEEGRCGGGEEDFSRLFKIPGGCSSLFLRIGLGKIEQVDSFLVEDPSWLTDLRAGEALPEITTNSSLSEITED